MNLKRLTHRLLRRHRFERFELGQDDGPQTYVEPRPSLVIWYVGYRCECGEPGYAVR